MTCARYVGVVTVRCAEPPQVYGGYTSFSTGGSLLPGDSVTYECVEGYVMTSQLSAITCGSDGDWSDLPVCSRIDTEPAPTAAPVKGEKLLLL